MTGFWLPAALSTDLPPGTAMPVATQSETLALWRSEAGRPAAFSDRCPHRGMRLSHGFVRGEALSCIYHGWSYGPSGQCLRIPAHPSLSPPQAIRAGAREVSEVDGILWIALGGPEGRAPRLPGLSPLRSLTANAPPSAVAACAEDGGIAGLVRVETRDTAFSALLAPQPEARTLIHVLVDETAAPAARLAASRGAEALRRAAEASACEAAA